MAKKNEDVPVPVPPAGAVMPTTALGSALGAMKVAIRDEDYDDNQKEDPQIIFGTVRQKDLRDARGGIVRGAGSFCFGKKDELTYEDRTELLVTVLGFLPGRVFFRDLNDKKPTCKSLDMKNGVAERTIIEGKPVFGDCGTCYFNQWGSAQNGKGKKCRENRRIFAMDWSRVGPIILTIGPSSLRPWGAHDEAVNAAARQFAKGGKVPFIHHLLQVKATLEYRAEPSGHYVTQWRDPVALPDDLQEQMSTFRQEALGRFRETAQGTEFEAEDFVGRDEPEHEEPAAAPQGDETLPF